MMKMGNVRSGPDLLEGDTLELRTKNEQTAHWGQGTVPIGLTVGARYTVTEVEVHSGHTLVYVVPQGYVGPGPDLGPFNEALFVHIPEANDA